MSFAASESAPAGAAPRRSRRRLDVFPYSLLIPSIILIGFINLYPFILGLIYSLQAGTLLKPGEFVGIDNYAALLEMADFQHALLFSAVFSLFSVFGSWLLGLGLALLINQDDVPGRGFFRVAFLLPWILPSIVSVIAWRWMLSDSSGLVNVVLGWFGVKPVYFLSTGSTAVGAVIAVKIWRSFPFMMLALLAALQTINRDEYEAASVDGASPWQRFRSITLPHLLPISVVLWILMTIWSVNDFETPWLLTQGGPSNATENLAVLAYRYTFMRSQLGIGAAISFVAMLLLMVLAIWLLRRKGAED
jgi:multiple sugar transport system permease protein